MPDHILSQNHPSQYIPAETLHKIRAYASDAEGLEKLHPEQLKVMYSQNWFRMLVPKNMGGLGLSLPEVVKTEEALAWADGSTAWVVTLCSGAGWFAGFLNHELCRSIFDDEKTCIAGSGAPTGTADIVDDGFVINGEWKYASGALHATMITANCVITRNRSPVRDEHGQPLIRAFIFFPGEVQLKKNWRTMGMVATASHGYTVKALHVPLNRSFQITSDAATLTDAVYQYPFLQLAEVTLAANFSGMAYRFIDLCEATFREKGQRAVASKAMDALGEATELLWEKRAEFFKALETSWSFCADNQPVPDVVLRQVSNRSHRLYSVSLNAVSSLYPTLGLRASDPESEANRVFRNIFTASQHTLFSMR